MDGLVYKHGKTSTVFRSQFYNRIIKTERKKSLVENIMERSSIPENAIHHACPHSVAPIRYSTTECLFI